jgi:hypothetical protein
VLPSLPEFFFNVKNKGKEKDDLKKTRLGPLRQGQRLDTYETKLCPSKEHKPPNQNSKTTKSSPCTHASSPWMNACKPLEENRSSASAQL